MKSKAAKKSARPAVKNKPKSRPVKVADGELFVGSRVHHRTFGNGTVVSVRQDKITVRFPRNVIKEILDIFLERRR